MQTKQLSGLQLGPVWEKATGVRFTFQPSPSLFPVLTKRPGRESRARGKPGPLGQLSLPLAVPTIAWPRHLEHMWASKTSALTRSSTPPSETPKATWGQGPFWCCLRCPPVLKTWASCGQVEQCLGTLSPSGPPAAAPARYPRASPFALNIHIRLTGSSPVVSQSPPAAQAGWAHI